MKWVEASSRRVNTSLSSIKSPHNLPRTATRGSCGSCDEGLLPLSMLNVGERFAAVHVCIMKWSRPIYIFFKYFIKAQKECESIFCWNLVLYENILHCGSLKLAGGFILGAERWVTLQQVWEPYLPLPACSMWDHEAFRKHGKVSLELSE